MNISSPKTSLPSLARLFFSFACCLFVGPISTPANAAPILNPVNNHYYEAVAVSGGVTWENARAAAAASTFAGHVGYLATLTSATENQFVLDNCPLAVQGNWWIGGFQDRTSPSYSEPGGGWNWVTGETFQFTNWQTNEPNNINGSAAFEDFLQILNNGKWNDNTKAQTLGGYVVEYEATGPVLSINDASISEGNAGTTNLVFTVSLANAGSNTITVHYATQNATASAPQDYTAASGDLTFEPGRALSQTITITVSGDVDTEPSEYFRVLLSAPTNAAVADGEGRGTIVNDDASPNSSGRIAFQSTRDGNSEIYTMKPDGTDVVRITNNTISEDNPDYSPNGNRLAFSSSRTGSNDIVTVKASDGSDLVVVTDGGPNQIQPTWRPDGARLAFSAFGGFDNDIYTISASGGADTRIINNPLGDYTPDWSPNGDKIAFVTFVSDAGYQNHIFVVNSDGSGQVQLTSGQFKDSDPAWSPDGTKIAFSSDRDGDHEIYVMNADGSGQTRITNEAGYDGQPSWSPDGTQIAFIAHSNNNDDIYVMNADGTARVRLTTSAAPDSQPSWGPAANTPVKPFLSIGNVSVAEGNSGTSNATFTVTLSAASSQTVTVDYATGDSTAIAGSDYTATSGTLTFAPNETSKTFTVPILGDSIDEDDKTFFVNLSNITNALIDKSQATGTITDDDLPPQLSIDSDLYVLEDNTGVSTDIVFTVTLSNASGRTVTVNYATSDGTATGGYYYQPNDYQAVTGTLTFAPGETTKTITVAAKGDTLDENDETFFVNLSNAANASLPPIFNPANNHYYEPVNISATWDSANTSAQSRSFGGVTGHLATITSAAEQSFFTSQFGPSARWLGGIQPLDAPEPAGGWQWVTGEPWSYTNWGGVEPNNSGSGNGEDALATGGTWNDLPTTGHLQAYVVEYDLTSAVEGPASFGMATIVDDDDAPTLSINDPAPKIEGSSGQSNLTFTITLSAASGKAVTVDYLAVDGSATSPNDYLPTSGTVTIPVGSINATVSVPVVGDTGVEDEIETFNLNLSNAVNATIADVAGVGIITDDDGSGVLTVSNVSLLEGNSGASFAVFTVTLSEASTRTITIDYSTAQLSALPSSDYQTTTGTLSFAPGDLTKTVSVPVFGNTTIEPDEHFLVKLSNPTNASVAPRIVRNPANNHYYELITANASTWDAANTAASARSFGGVSGHLATVTTYAEQAFLAKRFGSFAAFLGGSQSGGSAEPAGGWQWVTEEGWNYTNWQSGQPDNSGAGEDVLFHIAGAWTDASRTFTSNAYLVEYDLVAPVEGAPDDIGLGTILNDDGPAISINDVSLTENSTGTVNATFTVTLAAASAQTVTVDFATADGTATAGSDYTATAGTLTFSPNQLSKTITVPILSDGLSEGDETFVVNLSNATNAWTIDSQGTGTITEVQADLLIKKLADATSAYALNNVYQSTPSGQQIETQALSATALSASYNVRVQNDTTAARSFVLKTSESAESGWTLVYKADGIDVTTAIRSSLGYTTPSRAPDAYHTVTVEITREAGITGSKSATINVHKTGEDTIVRDSVQAVTTVDSALPTSCVTLVPGHNTFIGSNNLTELSGTAEDNAGGSGIVKVLSLVLRPKSGGGYEYWGLNGATKLYEWSATQRYLEATLTPTGTGGSNSSVSWKRTTSLPTGANLPPGTYYARGRAYDAAGNNKYSTLNTFTVVSDTVAPTAAALTSPVNGASLSTLTQVSGTASDNAGGSGINRVFVKLWRSVEGVRQWWGLNPSSGVYEWSSTERMLRADTVTPLNGESVNWSLSSNVPSEANLPDGTYSVQARAYDVVGNNRYSATNTFTVTAPVSAPLMSAPSSVTAAESDVTLSSAVAQVGGSGEAIVSLTFSEVLDGNIAGEADLYAVSVNGEQVEVQSVLYDSLTRTVTLSLPLGAFAKGDQVVVQWKELREGQGRLVADGSKTIEVS